MDCTAELCNKPWRVLSDKFVRELKKGKKNKPGDAGPPVVSTWDLFDVMSFVGDTVKHKMYIPPIFQ